MLHVVHRGPRSYGLRTTRWTLATLLSQCPELRVRTLAGLHQLLRRLRITWKRTRPHLRSPDPDYQAKLDHLQGLRAQVAAQPNAYVFTFLDEVTVMRQPTLANAYAAQGAEQRYAELSHQADRAIRLIATLDALTGRVIYRRATQITVSMLVQFYRTLREAYPQATRIYVVQDNWPVHFHPDVLVALEPQHNPWPWRRPSNWPSEPSRSATQRYGHLALPIQLVTLPTYASWANPIEKLWRKLRQDVTHLHPWANDLPSLGHELDTFLDQFALGSPALLRYVGLYPE